MEYSQRKVLGSRNVQSVSPVAGSSATTCRRGPATVNSLPPAYTGVERGGGRPEAGVAPGPLLLEIVEVRGVDLIQRCGSGMPGVSTDVGPRPRLCLRSVINMLGCNLQRHLLAVLLSCSLEGRHRLACPHLLEPEDAVPRHAVPPGRDEVDVTIPVHILRNELVEHAPASFGRYRAVSSSLYAPDSRTRRAGRGTRPR